MFLLESNPIESKLYRMTCFHRLNAELCQQLITDESYRFDLSVGFFAEMSSLFQMIFSVISQMISLVLFRYSIDDLWMASYACISFSSFSFSFCSYCSILLRTFSLFFPPLFSFILTLERESEQQKKRFLFISLTRVGKLITNEFQ